MTNPFEPPSSDIKINQQETDKRIGWIIFFLISLTLNIFSFYDIIQNFIKEEAKIDDFLILLVYPLVLLALYGYAFKKAYFNQLIWKILLPITLIIDIIAFIILFTEEENSFNFIDNTLTAIIFLLILSPLIIFQYIALYRYGFTNREPWDK